MNDYVLMCKNSPVQKDWIKKTGDNTNQGIIGWDFECFEWNLFDNGGCITSPVLNEESQTGFAKDYYGNEYPTINSLIWLPTQEQWQEIYSKGCPTFVEEALSRVATQFSRYAHNPDRTIPESLTIAWCLFVHKEVYGLVWSWDKKKWRDNGNN